MSDRRLLRTHELEGRQRYRLLTSLVVPRPIGWIGTRSRDGTANLAPFSYFNALSATPMLIGASVGRRRVRGADAPEPKDTLRNVEDTGAFSVSIVDERHLEAMVRTSGDWPPGISEFDAADLALAECAAISAPYVADAAATLECRLFRLVDLGDAPNTLVIGEVVAVRLGPELRVDPDTLHVDVTSLRPVGRLGRDEYGLLGEIQRHSRPVVPPPGDPGSGR
jgi:flavin reductase (DIM6/NTAB) family NADH-FMN oxidoreductase RutF